MNEYKLEKKGESLVFAEIECDKTILTNDVEKCMFAQECLIHALEVFDLVRKKNKSVIEIMEAIEIFVNEPF